MRKTPILIIFSLLLGFNAAAQTDMEISGTMEWDNMTVKAEVSLDLVSAGLKLPAGRTQAEATLKQGYQELIIPALLSLQVDSSSTIADLIERGELTLSEIESIAARGSSVAPSLSNDLRRITESHSISFTAITSVLLKHSRASPIIRTLNPISAARYTGIIIIAVDPLPVHGMRSSGFAVPCLFPKIWDSQMNLIYERSMLDTSLINSSMMVKYTSAKNIFQNNPSGLSAELQKITGDRPLRIYARGVFGIKPADLIIDRSDALLIISSEDNRRLLSQGKVVFVLDESMLRSDFNADERF